MSDPLREEPSVGELIGDLTSDLSTLIRSEVRLAAEESRVELRRAGRAAMAAGAAAVMALLAGVGLVMTAGFGLDELMPRWVAFALVTVVLAVIAAVAASMARARAAAIDPVPHETAKTIKEDIRWMNKQRN